MWTEGAPRVDPESVFAWPIPQGEGGNELRAVRGLVGEGSTSTSVGFASRNVDVR